MTSHEQRGGFVMLHSAAFPVAYVTSMTAPALLKETQGLFDCRDNIHGESLSEESTSAAGLVSATGRVSQ